MLLFGILAIFQTIVLPGFIFLNIFKITTDSFIQKWIYVFAFSLFLNYALVTVLVSLGLYKFIVILVLIGIEVLLLSYLILIKKISLRIHISFHELILEYISFFKSLSVGVKVIFIIVSLIILFYLSLLVANMGTIFYFVDTAYNIHWNTWAIDFSNNIYPKLSSHFPQLIPANWSLSYLITGQPEINFFPKSFMPLFFLSHLLLFLDMAIERNKLVYLFTLIIYGLFAPIIYSLVFIADGNGDLPVSFFTFLAFYAYLKVDKTEFRLKEYIIVFLFASTAAGTKLAGFYVFFFLSIYGLYQLIKNFKIITNKELIKLFFSVVFILAINLFWYFIKPKVMAGGLEQPEWLAEGYINILRNALHLLYYNWGLPVFAFLIVTIFFSLFTKEAKYITIIFVIPPIILWMFKYSSDFRNLSFVVPFIAYTSAFGVEKIYKIFKNKKDDLKLKRTEILKNVLGKNFLLGIIILFAISLVSYFLTTSNSFYQILYWIYSSINKYYFQSNRIVYFTDFTFFVHVDYYQKVISTMFLLAALIGLLYALRFRQRDLLILLIAGVIFLNYTFLTEPKIMGCQKDQEAKVDARNYYNTISTIVKSSRLDNLVFTNFKPIINEKIPRDIKFTYLNNSKIIEELNDSKTKQKLDLFIKKDTLDHQLTSDIKNSLLSGKSDNLFENNQYIFLELNKIK
jgi:hypothetical protein